MADITTVAAYILQQCGTMTTMKMQKIAFYAQAEFMARHARPLFADPISSPSSADPKRRHSQRTLNFSRYNIVYTMCSKEVGMNVRLPHHPQRQHQGEPNDRTPTVISLGQIWVDIMMQLDAVPEPGAFATSKRTSPTIGGSYPVLLAARRMGSPASHAAIIGNGMWADVIRERLAANGISHIGQHRVDADSGFRLVLTDGERKTFVASYGAESQGEEDTFSAIVPRPGDVVHISGNTLMDHTATGLDAFIRRLDVNPDDRPYTLVLNPINALQLVSDHMLENLVLARPLWSCNRQEAHTLAARLGVHLTDSQLTVGGSFDNAMRQLCDDLGSALRAPLVLRAGARGAWVRLPGGEVSHVEGFETKPVHTRSAGSCHTGALCAMLAQGWSLLDAVNIANAAASLAIEQHTDGVPRCPNRDDVMALVNAR